MPRLGQKKPLAERFWPKVDHRGDDECWPWVGGKCRGYGNVWDGEKRIGAHRASLILAGRDPGELDVLHGCNNPCCVNPKHLRAGSAKENMQDAIRAGTFVFPPRKVGEDANSAVLREEDVKEIRWLSANGEHTRTKISEMFGVSRATIRNCVNRTTWAHVA